MKTPPPDPASLVLWGRRKGAPEWDETVLCTQPERFEEVKKLAAADGFGHFRVARLGGLPDLGALFPETQIAAEAYNLNGMAAKIDEIDAEMHREIAALEERASKDRSNARAAILVAMLRARQRAELVKVPLFVELAQDGYAEGQSVAVFVNFRETLDAIVSRLETAKIGRIETIKGNQDGEEREAGIARFQADESRVIVAMIQAGGVGVSLHDLNGTYPRFAVISPTWSAVELRQTVGRVWRAGGKTKSVQRIVFVADSVEEKVRVRVAEKLARLDTLNDGDLGLPEVAARLGVSMESGMPGYWQEEQDRESQAETEAAARFERAAHGRAD